MWVGWMIGELPVWRGPAFIQRHQRRPASLEQLERKPAQVLFRSGLVRSALAGPGILLPAELKFIHTTRENENVARSKKTPRILGENRHFKTKLFDQSWLCELLLQFRCQS